MELLGTFAQTILRARPVVERAVGRLPGAAVLTTGQLLVVERLV